MGLFKAIKNRLSGTVIPSEVKVIEVDDANFEKQVLRRSHKVPVMVDFWASWCGPCRQLGPTLERLAESPDSGFILAKLNTEQNKRMSAKYNIRSIPAVKVFRNGHIVGQFTGVWPQGRVAQMMKQINSTPPPAPRVSGSKDPRKRLQQAIHHLKKANGFEAYLLLQSFPESKLSNKAQRLLPLAHFICDIDDGDGITGNKRLDEHHVDAFLALEDKDPDAAIQHLLAACQVGNERQQQQTTAVITALFELLGPKHTLTVKYQPQLAAATA